MSTFSEHTQAKSNFRILMLSQSGTLSNWATWEGNHFWTSQDNLTSLAYRKSGRVAVVVTEPLGENGASGIGEFLSFCKHEKLTPAFYCADFNTKERLGKSGWKHLEIGQEAVIKPSNFGGDAKLSRVIRQANNRAARNNVVAHWTDSSSLSSKQRQQISALLSATNKKRLLPALGFTLGNGRELNQGDVGVMLAVNQSQEIIGLTSWLPVYRNREIVGRTLETICRNSSGFSGLADFMIASSMKQFQAECLEIVSLSGIPLAKPHLTAPESKKSLGQIALRTLSKILDPIYGIRGLLRFKQKFDPQYRDLYLVFANTKDLPKILLAIARAYLHKSND